MFKLYAEHLHHAADPWSGAHPREIELRQMLGLLFSGQEFLMSANEDLKAAVADLATSIAGSNAAVETLLGKITASGTSDADVEAAVASIRSIIGTNAAEVAKVSAALTPAPAPAAAPAEAAPAAAPAEPAAPTA